MKITSSYDVQIVGLNKIFIPTVKIYREALSFLINVFDKEWDNLKTEPNLNKRFNLAEHLIHSTSKNTASYPDFDMLFYKMPAYFRRSAVSTALGAVSSYRSQYDNWLKQGKQGKAPKLAANRYCFPTFYRDGNYVETEDVNIIKLKLFIRNDWIWVPVRLRSTDIKYIQKHCQGKEMSAPIMEKRHSKYYLRFAFTENVTLNKTEIRNQRIVSVDLGVNTDAVCSLMTSDGTVLDRKFIDFPGDKDRLYHTLNKIKRMQKRCESVSKLWSYVKNCNKEHSIKTATAIVEYATANNADCIVFEKLDMKGKISGNKKQKLHMWRKCDIQNIVEHKAHTKGIRISHICAWNTSALAFDGSGPVSRNENNHSICTFTTGKTYNCDLSASYNIGARYFIREILKTLPVTVRSELETKVSSITKRTQCTLSTLINLNAVMRDLSFVY